MTRWRDRNGLVAVLLWLASSVASAQTPHQGGTPDLDGTFWQLVIIQGNDSKSLIPDDPAKYTLGFNADGFLTARVDCNKGRGAWTSSASQLHFGPIALTRAICPFGSLHDRVADDLSRVQSYVVGDDDHLILSLADGGTYEFEPLTAARSTSVRSPVVPKGPLTYACKETGGGTDTLIATFYGTQPALVLVERMGQTRPAFRVTVPNGTKYEGEDLEFWDARGKASVMWSGVELKCKRR